MQRRVPRLPFTVSHESAIALWPYLIITCWSDDRFHHLNLDEQRQNSERTATTKPQRFLNCLCGWLWLSREAVSVWTRRVQTLKKGAAASTSWRDPWIGIHEGSEDPEIIHSESLCPHRLKYENLTQSQSRQYWAASRKCCNVGRCACVAWCRISTTHCGIPTLKPLMFKKFLKI